MEKIKQMVLEWHVREYMLAEFKFLGQLCL